MSTALVVDDSRVIRQLCRTIMEDLGYDVVEAEDGSVAMEQAAKHAPQVILLDWNMPVMDGMQFLLAFRQLKEHKDAKVIFCTTENDFSKIQAAMAAGADEYIMKPFDKSIVQDKLVQLGVLEGS